MLDVMCVEPASNVTRLVQLLKMSSIPEKLKLVNSLFTFFVVLSLNLLSVRRFTFALIDISYARFFSTKARKKYSHMRV